MSEPKCTCRYTVEQSNGEPRYIHQGSHLCPLHAAAGDLYTALELYVAHFSDPLKIARAALLKANPQRTQEVQDAGE